MGDTKPKEERKAEKGAPSLSVPFFSAFAKPDSTKTGSITSPSPTPEQIQVITKLLKRKTAYPFTLSLSLRR